MLFFRVDPGRAAEIARSFHEGRLEGASAKMGTAVGGGLGAGLTSRAARREAMRRYGIPTSRPANRQVRPRQAPSDRQYQYDASNGQTQTVTHHSADDIHPNPHWEAGTAKQPERTDPLGRLRYRSDKTKEEYEP